MPRTPRAVRGRPGRVDAACESCQRAYWHPNEKAPESPSKATQRVGSQEPAPVPLHGVPRRACRAATGGSGRSAAPSPPFAANPSAATPAPAAGSTHRAPRLPPRRPECRTPCRVGAFGNLTALGAAQFDVFDELGSFIDCHGFILWWARPIAIRRAASLQGSRVLLQAAADRCDALRIEAKPVHPSRVPGVLDLDAAIHDDGKTAGVRDAGAGLVDHRELTP
jgi:hypothetical protein